MLGDAGEVGDVGKQDRHLAPRTAERHRVPGFDELLDETFRNEVRECLDQRAHGGDRASQLVDFANRRMQLRVILKRNFWILSVSRASSRSDPESIDPSANAIGSTASTK